MNTQVEMIKAGISLGVSAGITEFSKAIVNVYVKPKLEEIKDKFKKDEIESITHDFSEYIERSYRKNLYMNTIVFRNQQKTVDDLYIPLSVKKSELMDKDKDSDTEIYINEYKDEFIPTYKKILLVDSAGMGKSTVMKYLYLSSIRQNKGIPILIELRKLNKETSIIDFIKNEINGISVHFKREEIIELIERGDFIFFFDGYDEINYESKNKVTDSIQEFISKAGNNCFIISSRDENELSSFGDFQRFDITRLKKEEVYDLICKYDGNGELSKELVDKLETEKNLKIINEFLDNPLMVSLLYTAFEYKKTIPYKKHIFYRQVYDALFEQHDLTKGGAYVHHKKSKLDVEDFHKVMRYIGFNTLSKGVNYQKEELIGVIESVKQKIIDVDFKVSDLIYDLTHSVPIFVKEGNQYRWIHKSFQDYFAAFYICFDAKENSDKILKKMSQSNKIRRYYNVLDFCYDIDYISFAKSVIYPVLQELELFVKNIYIDNEYSNYDQEELYRRKMILFRNNKIRVRKLNEEEVGLLEVEMENENFDKFKYFFDEENSTFPLTSMTISQDMGIEYSEKINITTLIDLLYDKKSTIIYENGNNRTGYIWLNKHVKSGYYILDDDINNELNKKEFFSRFSDYFEEMGRTSRRNNDMVLNLRFSKCMELKNEIEKEIKNKVCDFDFL